MRTIAARKGYYRDLNGNSTKGPYATNQWPRCGLSFMELNFTEMGNGPPLVILHGLYGSSRNWGGIAKALSDDFRVVAVDLPNHGISPWLDVITYEEMADAVAAFIASRGFVDTALLGHSMGGKTAMVLAHRHPELASALIVADIAPVTYDHARENDAIIAALQAVPLDKLRRRREADVHLTAAVPDPSVRAFLLQNLVQADGRFQWRIDLDGLAASLPAILGFPLLERSFAKPVLFIVGGQSVYVRPHQNNAIYALFPGARIEVIDDAGHWLHAEDPEEFIRILRDFLSE